MFSQQIRSSAAGSSSLLDSIDAVRNWRAVVLLLVTFVIAALVAGLGGSLAQTSYVLTLLFMVLALAVAFYGANAAGMMMMDEASGHVSRPIRAAVMSSVATSHRLIVALVVIGVIYLIGLLVFVLLLFVCKIPGIGPLLYTVVFPAGILVSGVALFAIPTVIFPLAAPAIWSGAGTMAAVSQLMAVARKRLLLVLMLMILVSVVAYLVGGLIFAILLSGTWFTGLTSAAVLGMSEIGGLAGIGTSLLGSVTGSGGLGSGAGGYAVAAMIGGGVVWAAALTLPGLVYLRGASSVYLRAIEGLDLVAEQEALREKVAAAQAKAREFQAQAQATAHQYAQRAQAATPVMTGASAATNVVVTPATAAPGCPSCGAVMVPGDVFCGNCGHKLA